MKIKAVYFENQDDFYLFDSSDQEKINQMVRSINDPENDVLTYYTESGEPIWHWPLDGNTEDNEEYEYSYVGIDFGPSNPWDAPGMSVSDFI